MIRIAVAILLLIVCLACKPITKQQHLPSQVTRSQLVLKIEHKNGKNFLAVCVATVCENALLREGGKHFYFTNLEAISGYSDRNSNKSRLSQIFVWSSFAIACATTIGLSRSWFAFLKRKLTPQWSRLNNDKLVSEGVSASPDMKVEMAAEAHAEIIDGIPRDMAIVVLSDLENFESKGEEIDSDAVVRNLSLVEKLAPQYRDQITELKQQIKDGDLELANEKTAYLARRIRSELRDSVGIPSMAAFVSALILRKNMEDNRFAGRKEDFIALVRYNKPMRVKKSELRTLLSSFAKATDTHVNENVFLLSSGRLP